MFLSFIGSPFVIKVSAPPDASKVRVTGPGVEHGILARFQSKFIVETKGAGAGQLTVRVRGPKGNVEKTHVLLYANFAMIIMRIIVITLCSLLCNICRPIIF